MENPWPIGTYTTLLLASERLAVPREATRGHPGAAPAWPARPRRQGAALYLPQSAGGLGLGGARLLSCGPTTWPSIFNTFPRYGPGLWGAGKDQEPAGTHGSQMGPGPEITNGRRLSPGSLCGLRCHPQGLWIVAASLPASRQW